VTRRGERPRRRRRFLRVAGRFALALLVVVIVAGLVFRSWVAGQARVVVVLVSVEDTPVLSWTVRVVTDEPEVSEVVVAGVRSTLARPRGEGPWPAAVFVNGATQRGRHHPKVQGLARGLARAGYLVLVPDLPGLRAGEITPRTAEAAAAVARETADRPDVGEGKVALYGVSVGATLALLAAEAEALAARVSVVAGLAPYTDLVNAMRLASTGHYRSGRRLHRYDADPFLGLVVARSLAAGLRPGRDREVLLGRLRALPDDAASPLRALREPWTRRLRGDAAAMVRLLLNRDPRRFEGLYAALSPPARASIEALSPLRGAGRLRAPVELATAPRDKYFPPAESHALARVAPNVRVTLTRSLEHAIPEPSVDDLRDLLRLDGFLLRALGEAR
jgi:pimeloyl-ACP methyl ester carboxylesterase